MSLNRSRGLPRKKQPERASHNRQEFPTLRSLIVPVGSRVVDLINPSRAMVYSAGIVGSVHSKGRYVNNTADGTSEIQAEGACQYQTFSRIAIIRRNFNTGLTGTISDSAFNTAAGGAQWATSAGAVSEILLNAANTVQVGISSGASMVTGTEYVVGVSYDGSTVRFFIDGRAVGSTFKVQTFTIQTSASLFSRGGTATENEQFNGAIGLHADFEGALPSDVMLSLTANPWQLLRPADIDRPYSTASGGTILIAVSDLLTPSLTEVRALFSSSSIVDTLTPSISESVNLAVLLTAVDTLTASVTETQTTLAGISVSDIALVSVAEALASLVSSSVTDTITPSVTETSGVGVTLTVSDTITPAVTETTATVAAIATSDALTPSLTETQASLVYAVVSEALTVSLGEVQGSLVSSSITDVFTLSVTDASSLLIAITATDTFVVSVTDAATVVGTAVIEKNVADTLAPFLTEASSLVLMDLWVKDGAAVGVWTVAGGVTGTWTKDTPL